MSVSGETPFRFSSAAVKAMQDELARVSLTEAEWKTLVKVAHPDQGGNAGAMAIVQRIRPKKEFS